MARGQKSDVTLVPFNSKVRPEIKALADALVAVKANGAKSTHDLITDMLDLYVTTYPAEADAAKKYMKLMAERPDEPIAGRG